MREKMKNGKKGIAVILSLCIVMAGAASDKAMAAKANEHVKTIKDVEARTTKPSEENKYFYDWNVYYQSGYGIPNCTCYVYGRTYEVTGLRPALCTGDASSYYSYNKYFGPYEYGENPRPGSIGVFTGGSEGDGHVVFVESVNPNGTVNISESNWGADPNGNRAFKYLTYINPYTQWPGLNFQGYLYVATGDSNGAVGIVGNSNKTLSKEAYLGYKIMDLSAGVSYGFMDRKEENNKLK